MPNNLDDLAAEVEAMRTHQRTVIAQLESDTQSLARKIAMLQSGGNGREAEIGQLQAELGNLRGAVAAHTRVAENLRMAIRGVLAEYDKLPCRGADTQAIAAARTLIG